MSQREKEKYKFDLKKMEKQIELEGKKNIRWIIAGAICLGIAFVITFVVRNTV